MKVLVFVLALWVAFSAQSPAAQGKEENALQETCGKDAGQFYRNRFENSFEKGTTTYRPYYHKTLNACMVSISIHGYRKQGVMVDSIYTVLYDLKARKELGSLFQVFGDKSESYPHCITPEKSVAKCTPADWDAFVRRYMEE